MTLKQYIAQAPTLKNSIACAKEQLDELKDLGITSRSVISTVNSPVTKGFLKQIEHITERINQMEMKLIARIDEYTEVCENIQALIERLPNINERTMMEKHYLQNKSWEDTADECCYSIRAVYYLHNEALKHLEPFYRNYLLSQINQE
jgi:DNA-directed RNA polymerase specialized sigma subunit